MNGCKLTKVWEVNSKCLVVAETMAGAIETFKLFYPDSEPTEIRIIKANSYFPDADVAIIKEEK